MLLALQSTKYLVGIIIAVICSNWVGEAINYDGIYETDLEADGSVIFLRPSPPQALFTKTAGDIAAQAVWCEHPLCSVALPCMLSPAAKRHCEGSHECGLAGVLTPLWPSVAWM